MTQQILNYGNSVNDGTGDTLRVASVKINDNFTDLYTKVTSLTGLTLPPQTNFQNGLLTTDGLSLSWTASPITVDNLLVASGQYSNPIWITSLAYSKLTGAPVLSAVATTGSYQSLLNKPVFAAVATSGSYNDLLNLPTIPAAQVNSDWNSSSGISRILNKPTLASVATSGSYNDLSNKPSLSTVATSGSYNDLSNKPSLFSGAYSDLTGKPSLFSGAYSDLTGKPSLFSGAYADLTGKPDLSVYQLSSSAFNGNYNSLTNKPSLATVATSGSYSDLSGTPTLSTVATSGDYRDLSHTPSIPSIGNFVFTGSTITSTGNSTVEIDENVLVKESISIQTSATSGSYNSVLNFNNTAGLSVFSIDASFASPGTATVSLLASSGGSSENNVSRNMDIGTTNGSVNIKHGTSTLFTTSLSGIDGSLKLANGAMTSDTNIIDIFTNTSSPNFAEVYLHDNTEVAITADGAITNWSFKSGGMLSLPPTNNNVNIDASAAGVITLNTNDTVTFTSFSGMIIINDNDNGYVYTYIMGSGSDPVLLGTTNLNPTLTDWVTFVAGTGTYVFTNKASSRDYNFVTIKTRNNA